VLFIKAYTLNRTTVKGGARASADVEAAAGEGASSVGTPTAAEVDADLSDEKSEVHNEALQADSKDRDRTPADTADQNTRADAPEKV